MLMVDEFDSGAVAIRLRSINPTDAVDAIPFDFVRARLVGSVLTGLNYDARSGDITMTLASNQSLVIRGSLEATPLQYDPDIEGVPSAVPIVLGSGFTGDASEFTKLVAALDGVFTALFICEFGSTEKLEMLSDFDGAVGSELLEEVDRLYIATTHVGSFWGEFKCRSKKALRIVLALASGLSSSGRKHLDDRLEAEARIHRAAAAKAEAEVQRMQIENFSSIYEVYETKISRLPESHALRRSFEEQYAVLRRHGAYKLPRPPES